MRKFHFLIVVLCFFAAGNVSAQKIEFTSMEINYGEIEQGADGLREFTFKNAGDQPLVITSARGSCGCTVPSYANTPLNAGESGSIQVRYDTNRIGAFTKFVTVTTNDAQNASIRLTIKGTVKAKETTGQ